MLHAKNSKMLAVKRTFYFIKWHLKPNILQLEIIVRWNHQERFVKLHMNCHFCAFSSNCHNLRFPHYVTHVAEMCRWGRKKKKSHQLFCSGVRLSLSPVNNRIIQECCHVFSVFVNPSYLPLIPGRVRGSDLICEGQGLLYVSHIKYCLIMI